MFPERLRALRKGQHLTLSDLAENLNEEFNQDAAKTNKNTASQIGNWERGVRKPSYVEVQKLAKFFDVTMDYLTGLAENNTYDLAKLFISDKTLLFNGEQLNSKDRYEIYQLISGYVHGMSSRVEKPGPHVHQEELDLGQS
ncbi:transcriptional regulator [Lentilactobacillus fungorum]|uniref:Transcriptional regulator n=1 Tax=Lentilactobacillus fungorum TaxID=2201250 RepID=A0ABQ3W2S6_9LACO|nr:helix-turn-helix transcriptional regulator [Lentilactobacillus fungorum]GHP14849.1 transcriptional regulator [Lentilactobacillus fungorum]